MSRTNGDHTVIRISHSTIAASFALAFAAQTNAAELVTVDNFERAETQRTMQDYVNLGGFGKFHHIRKPVPIDAQAVVRMRHSWHRVHSMLCFDWKKASGSRSCAL